MSEKAKRHRTFLRPWMRRLVVTVVALLLVVLLARAVWGYVAASKLCLALAAIRASGHPVTVDELEALTPAVDPGNDAGRYYAAAMALGLERWEKVDETMDKGLDALAADPGNAPTAELLDRIAAVLDENRADDGGDVGRSGGAKPKDWGVRVRFRTAPP